MSRMQIEPEYNFLLYDAGYLRIMGFPQDVIDCQMKEREKIGLGLLPEWMGNNTNYDGMPLFEEEVSDNEQ